ncbi:MAG: hypothetical protein KAH01_00830 [Caldisericia bacterium]|nr:hypothetical protein [Caldisericia bacterium]
MAHQEIHSEDEINSAYNIGLKRFEGYSPFEIEVLLNYTFDYSFEDISPIKLNKLNETEYLQVPILNQVIYLCNIIFSNNELNLTKKGSLQKAVVLDIYNQGILKDKYIESGLVSLQKEKDAFSIKFTKDLLLMTHIAKKRYNKISLTKKGVHLLKNKGELLKTLFKAIGYYVNWDEYDRYGKNNISSYGYGFSIILLNRFGTKKHKCSFYANKYISAFPFVEKSFFSQDYGNKKQDIQNCYTLRTFDHFTNYFGITETFQKDVDSEKYVTKTPLFGSLFSISSHSKNLFSLDNISFLRLEADIKNS